ncbi:MAG: hypothetical protein M4D80_26425 [Myxococcota bacterium]|nr:hypothetical protein [Myxococcota bacterium]
MHRIAAGLLALLLGGATAHAGRTHFGWSYGTDVIPERGTELEWWILEENKEGDTNKDETAFWWGLLFALSPHWEIGITTEAQFEKSDVEEPDVRFTRWGGELRYRPQSPDPIDAGPFATKFRIGVKRLIEERAGIRGEADVIASYTSGRVHVAADLGVIAIRLPEDEEVELRPSGGVSVRVVQDFRIGVETYAEVPVVGEDSAWWVVGPTVSLTSGRFWGAATYGVGILGIRDAPRITFGAAL